MTSPTTTETVLLIPVAQCHKSPTQPRRRGGDKPDDDMVASVREKGVLQPIIVRTRPAKLGGWEVVFGHRRHGASVIAERDTIPAIVRELSDDDVMEAQLIENMHREDMHPLDEADGFKRLLDRGRTMQHIAEKIGRPVTYVAQRLKLCELSKPVRDALDKEEISLGLAVLLARVPVTLQGEAMGSLWRGMSLPEAKRNLEQTYLLRLDKAEFDIASAELVPKAGACTACPKRTGAQRELFPDVARGDMCTDRVCYRSKQDALWSIRKKDAGAAGQDVLEGAAAAKAMQYGSPFKKLDEVEYSNGKTKKIRALFPKKEMPPVTLARDDKSGAIVELVPAAAVAKALKQRAPDPDSKYDSRSGMTKGALKKEKRKKIAVARAIGAAVENVGKLPKDGLVRMLTHALAGNVWEESQRAVLTRRGLGDKKKDGKKLFSNEVERKLVSLLKEMTKPAEVAGLGLELALMELAPTKWQTATATWSETLKDLGVDFSKIEAEVAAEEKAKKSKGGKKAKPVAEVDGDDE